MNEWTVLYFDTIVKFCLQGDQKRQEGRNA